MQITNEQRKVLESIHAAFGYRVKSARIVSASRKVMHVRVEVESGLWEYMIDPDGNMTNVLYTQRLFNMEN